MAVESSQFIGPAESLDLLEVIASSWCRNMKVLLSIGKFPRTTGEQLVELWAQAE